MNSHTQSLGSTALSFESLHSIIVPYMSWECVSEHFHTILRCLRSAARVKCQPHQVPVKSTPTRYGARSHGLCGSCHREQNGSPPARPPPPSPSPGSAPPVLLLLLPPEVEVKEPWSAWFCSLRTNGTCTYVPMYMSRVRASVQMCARACGSTRVRACV